MARTVLYVFGAIFVVTGLWAFAIPGPILGIFPVMASHALIHLVTGAVLLAVAIFASGSSALVAKIFGVVYAVVAVWGFVMADGMILGLIDVNLMDNILHTVIALVLLWAGFMTPMSVSEPLTTPSSDPL